MLQKLSLEGKTVIITGGGTGMGREMSIQLAAAGADLALIGRRPDPLEEVAGKIRDLGRRAMAIPTDITDSAQVNRMVESVLETFGKVDVLINNAGQPAEPLRNIWDITDAQWHAGMDANLTGAFYCCRAVIKSMTERGRGRIINVSSHFGMRGVRGQYVYTTAKGGLINLTRTIAVSMSREGITCVALVPGAFYTEATAPSREAMPNTGHVPIGFFGNSEQVGPAVVFLASEASEYFNGEVFPIDGGVLAGGISPTGYAPLIPWEAGVTGGL